MHQVFPVCILEELKDDSQDLKLAEQVFVDLFQTTSNQVLNLQSYSDTVEDQEGSSTHDLPEGEKMNRVAKYIVDKDEACILLDLGQQVFSRTKWPGGARRDVNAGTAFGAQAGLNWSMPLTELRFTRTTWTLTSVPGKTLNFRRTGSMVYDDDGRKALMVKRRADGSQFTFYLPQHMPGPDYGTPIQVVFEIRMDGQIQPDHLSRMPLVGPFDDWFDALTVGMHIEWQDRSNNTLTRPVQLDHFHNHIVTGGPNGATTGYAVATGLKAFFLHRDRKATNQFPWLMDFGTRED